MMLYIEMNFVWLQKLGPFVETPATNLELELANCKLDKRLRNDCTTPKVRMKGRLLCINGIFFSL
jgi:hypothetical protein